jgi:hypothetical protein
MHSQMKKVPGIAASVLGHRCFGGGGFGFGTPVVSYAPRPMLQGIASLVIMWNAEKGVNFCAIVETVEREKGEQAAIYRRSQARFGSGLTHVVE